MNHEFARTHARASDPETSAAAAESVLSAIPSQQAEILETLNWAGHALAAHEMANRCDLTAHQISRRLADLRRDGLIEDSGERAATPSNRRSVRWELTARGVELSERMYAE